MMNNRLPKGKRTSEDYFNVHILRVLNDLNGRAKLEDVSDRVYRLIKPKLKDVDHDYLKKEVRWSNTLRFAGKNLKAAGYIRSDSPHGIWEITETGREIVKKKDEQERAFNALVELEALASESGYPCMALQQAMDDKFPLDEALGFFRPKKGGEKVALVRGKVRLVGLEGLEPSTK